MNQFCQLNLVFLEIYKYLERMRSTYLVWQLWAPSGQLIWFGSYGNQVVNQWSIHLVLATSLLEDRLGNKHN